MDVKCSGCFAITTVFSHAQSVVVCGSCSQVLCQPTGGKARLVYGASSELTRLLVPPQGVMCSHVYCLGNKIAMCSVGTLDPDATARCAAACPKSLLFAAGRHEFPVSEHTPSPCPCQRTPSAAAKLAGRCQRLVCRCHVAVRRTRRMHTAAPRTCGRAVPPQA